MDKIQNNTVVKIKPLSQVSVINAGNMYKLRNDLTNSKRLTLLGAQYQFKTFGIVWKPVWTAS